MRNNECRFKPRKLKVKHDIKTIKDKPMLLPNLVARDFVLPLAYLLGTWIDPYRTSSIIYLRTLSSLPTIQILHQIEN